MWILSNPKVSGTHKYSQLTATSERDLADAERRLKVRRHAKGNQVAHLDLTEHQAELARRYGANQQD